MFPEWLQLQTSNLIGALPTWSTIYEHKTRSQAQKLGHVAVLTFADRCE